MARGRPSSRERILDIAEQIVSTDGPAGLTYEALAQRSGISRGGILYNFPNKTTLVEALVERAASRLTSQAEALQDADTKPARAHAYAKVLLGRAEETPTLDLGLLYEAINNPEVLRPLRKELANILAVLTQSTGKVEVAALLLFAFEGITVFKRLGIYPLDTAQEQALHRLIEQMLGQASDPPEN